MMCTIKIQRTAIMRMAATIITFPMIMTMLHRHHITIIRREDMSQIGATQEFIFRNGIPPIPVSLPTRVLRSLM